MTILDTGRLALIAATFLLARGRLDAEDCNSNGIDDRLDLSPGGFGFPTRGEALKWRVGPDPRFTAAGDLDGDGEVDLAVECQGDNLANRTGAGLWVLLLAKTAVAWVDEYPREDSLYSLGLGDTNRDGF